MSEGTEKLTLEKLSNALDEQLLQAVTDNPTAATLNVARQRLKDLKYTKVAGDGDPIDELADELGFANGKLPPMSEEPDAATP